MFTGLGDRHRGTALVVDDQELNRFLIVQSIAGVFDAVEAEDGAQALELLYEDPDRFTVILLDLVMPVMNGYEVMRRLNADDMLARIPAIVITGEDNVSSLHEVYDLGASEVINKPFDPGIVLRRVCNTVDLFNIRLDLEQQVREQAADIIAKNEELERLNNQISAILDNVMEYRDCDTAGHVDRVKGYTMALADALLAARPHKAIPAAEIDDLGRAAALHDIGKIAIPDAILFKPGKLTSGEFDFMKTHTVSGYELVQSAFGEQTYPFERFALEIARSHHEKWDGRGYPDGLRGDEIPLSAQLCGLADIYDALTSDRPYKKAFPAETAVQMIADGECGEFDPELLEVFLHIAPSFAEMYPHETRVEQLYDPIAEYRALFDDEELVSSTDDSAMLEHIVRILLDNNRELRSRLSL